MKRIAYTKPSITELEVSYATDAAQNGWGERCYDYINRFEAEFRQYVGTEYAIATSSCTGSLHIGMAGLGIGDGDEVIVADTNYIAAIAPIVHLGATPVFLDVLPDTWCLDVSKVEASITPRTRAILATHLYGNLVDMDALIRIAAAHGIPVIEDAAEAIGSVYNGRPAGSMGRFGAFSFHGTKTLTTGEGGIFVTDDGDLFERVLTLSNHGRSRSRHATFVAEIIGYKYKMSNIQAAIGCAQLARIDELVSRKQEILDYYRAALETDPRITLNPVQSGCVSGAWMPTVRVDYPGRCPAEDLSRVFGENQIDVRPFFSPISSFEMFTDCPENQVAHRLSREAINLPSYAEMTDDDQDRISGLVLELTSAYDLDPSR
jgi:perosamine synthetase